MIYPKSKNYKLSTSHTYSHISVLVFVFVIANAALAACVNLIQLFPHLCIYIFTKFLLALSVFARSIVTKQSHTLQSALFSFQFHPHFSHRLRICIILSTKTHELLTTLFYCYILQLKTINHEPKTPLTYPHIFFTKYQLLNTNDHLHLNSYLMYLTICLDF